MRLKFIPTASHRERGKSGCDHRAGLIDPHQLKLELRNVRIERVYGKDSHTAKAGYDGGTFDPPIDFAKEAEAAGCYGENVTDAAIVDTKGVVMAASDRTQEGQPLPLREDLATVVDAPGLFDQLRAIYGQGGRTLEVRQPLLLGSTSQRASMNCWRPCRLHG